MDDTTGSRTARAVAVGRAVGVGGHRDEHVTALLPARDRWVAAAARGLGVGRGRRVAAWSGHPALRMLAVDAAVEDALRATDADTLVVVGAGYDTRAWRLEELHGRTVIEVDHPATQAEKRQRLGDVEVREAPVGLVLAGADLASDDLDRVLAGAGHDVDQPTVWLWEAVVPYLSAAAVDTTLAVLRDRSAPGSRLVVTTVTPQLFGPRFLGRPLAGPARLVMAALGEPVLSAEADDAFAARLSRHGFAHLQVTGPGRWAADAGLQLAGPHLDERLHVATRRGDR